MKSARCLKAAAPKGRYGGYLPFTPRWIVDLSPWPTCGALAEGPGARSSRRPAVAVIAKWMRDDPAGRRSDPFPLVTKRAALEFPAGNGFHSIPSLIAYTPDLLLLEDLAPMVPLANRLRERGAAACEADLGAFTATMGELAAATVGRGADYQRTRRRAGASAG